LIQHSPPVNPFKDEDEKEEKEEEPPVEV